jgi:arachidonate 15-lipoxygenase
MELVWPLRRAFWDGLALVKYRSSKPAPIPIPQEGQPPVNPVSLSQRVPAIPISNILVGDHIPEDETVARTLRFFQLQVALYRRFPPMQDQVPPVDDDPHKALAAAYTAVHRRQFPPPALPPELDPPDLGALAVASPYACYLQRAPDGSFEWDLRMLDAYETHDGLLGLGVHVRFEVDAAARTLRAVEIDCELGRCRPGDAAWARAQRLALCAATTYVSLVRHYNWTHLAAGSALAIATRNRLPVSHPVQRLLWPHMFRTQYSNHVTTLAQLSPGGDFESTFSFTRNGVWRLFGDTYDRFDVLTLDPPRDAERRGIVDAGFDTPALDNHAALFEVMHAHARRYLGTYYGSDAAIRDDADVQAWVAELDRLTPNGVRPAFGGVTTVDDTARLIGVFIYMATVVHDVLGSGLWDYQLWTHVNPVRMYKSDERVPADVYKRLVNANFILNIHRSPLMQDFSPLAVDPAGADAFRRFLTDLEALQARLDQEPPASWRVTPRLLEANING